MEWEGIKIEIKNLESSFGSSRLGFQGFQTYALLQSFVL